MPRNYSKGKRDANEAEICIAIKYFGGYYRKMPETCGFDLLVVFPQTGVHIVEVKNPEYNWTLTDAELKMKKNIEYHGGQYNIVEQVEEIQDLAEGD